LISWGKQISAEGDVVCMAIKAVNLTKYYGKLLAVDHINFEVMKAHGNGGSIGFQHMC
jgi:hypothetical protein